LFFVRRISRTCKVILLTADVDVIAERIKDDKNRPSLTGDKSFVEEIGAVLAERKSLYEKAADFMIDTTNLTIEKVAEKIIWRMKK